MIYADNAATTPISDVAFAQMLPFLREQYGNASSVHSFGTRSRRAIEFARKQVAGAIGAEPENITFTSGGSEANTWVLRGVFDLFENEGHSDRRVHIITSAIEHPSVLNTCRALQKKGAEITYLPVDSVGRVSLADVQHAVRPDTKLVSVMLANNEIGTIQPIAEIGAFLQERRILFHTDAVQAVGHIPVHVNALHVDFLSASAHKFHGAKGTGFLYKRSGVLLPPLIFGGEQERGARAGTENVAGIIAAGVALEECVANMTATSERLKNLVETTVAKIREKIPDVRVNGDAVSRLPGTINLGFNGVAGEAMMNMLNLRGIYVSTGSACASGQDVPSYVLLALGNSETQAKSAIRISYSNVNTSEEADMLATAVWVAYEKIRNAK